MSKEEIIERVEEIITRRKQAAHLFSFENKRKQEKGYTHLDYKKRSYMIKALEAYNILTAEIEAIEQELNAQGIYLDHECTSGLLVWRANQAYLLRTHQAIWEEWTQEHENKTTFF